MRLTATLNTSSDNQGQQRYVRFSNDAKIKIKASVNATGNITFYCNLWYIMVIILYYNFL